MSPLHPMLDARRQPAARTRLTCQVPIRGRGVPPACRPMDTRAGERTILPHRAIAESDTARPSPVPALGQCPAAGASRPDAPRAGRPGIAGSDSASPAGRGAVFPTSAASRDRRDTVSRRRAWLRRDARFCARHACGTDLAPDAGESPPAAGIPLAAQSCDSR
jgi:hypothetical protein